MEISLIRRSETLYLRKGLQWKLPVGKYRKLLGLVLAWTCGFYVHRFQIKNVLREASGTPCPPLPPVLALCDEITFQNSRLYLSLGKRVKFY